MNAYVYGCFVALLAISLVMWGYLAKFPSRREARIAWLLVIWIGGGVVCAALWFGILAD